MQKLNPAFAAYFRMKKLINKQMQRKTASNKAGKNVKSVLRCNRIFLVNYLLPIRIYRH